MRDNLRPSLPRRNEDFVRLAELQSRLDTLKENVCLVVIHDSKTIAEIYLGKDSPLHYIVRPSGCTPKMLRDMNSEIVLSLPEPPRTFALDPNGIGGYYVAGVTLRIADHVVTLPEKIALNEEIKISDTSLVSTPIELAVQVLVGDSKLQQLSASSSLGVANALIGLGTRRENQDLLGVVMPEHGAQTLFIVDGNGLYGASAAKLVSDLLLSQLSSEKSATPAFKDIGRRFTQVVATQCPNTFAHMGACAVVADINVGHVTFSHIGDSRGLVLRRDYNGQYATIFMTKDHSITQEFIDCGHREDEVPRQFRSSVTRNITFPHSGKNYSETEVSRAVTLEEGDLIVLHSDGIKILDYARLLQVCTDNQSTDLVIAECSKEINKAVDNKTANGKRSDNYSLIIFKYGSTSKA